LEKASHEKAVTHLDPTEAVGGLCLALKASSEAAIMATMQAVGQRGGAEINRPSDGQGRNHGARSKVHVDDPLAWVPLHLEPWTLNLSFIRLPAAVSSFALSWGQPTR
jgi:hypothetical protein